MSLDAKEIARRAARYPSLLQTVVLCKQQIERIWSIISILMREHAPEGERGHTLSELHDLLTILDNEIAACEKRT